MPMEVVLGTGLCFAHGMCGASWQVVWSSHGSGYQCRYTSSHLGEESVGHDENTRGYGVVGRVRLTYRRKVAVLAPNSARPILIDSHARLSEEGRSSRAFAQHKMAAQNHLTFPLTILGRLDESTNG